MPNLPWTSLQLFFVNLKIVFELAKRRNFRYYNVSIDENPQRVNEMDTPSLESFHTQLDWKLTKGNKNQIQLTPV